MNLRVPYSWLQEYLSKKIPAARAAELLTNHSASVERIYSAHDELEVGESKIRVPEKEVVFEIETTTNRPDLLSVAGLARELGALTGVPLRSPKIRPIVSRSRRLKIKNQVQKLCPRYVGVRLEGVKVGPSPAWLALRLSLAGIRPINNVVDVTNYVMLEMGQPLHVFDADHVGETIVIRTARVGESIKALDGKTYELLPDMLVIADGKNPIAIAGVMGGEASGVTPKTTSIILESASFDPISVRRTSRALNLRSESSARFERGLSSESQLSAGIRAVELITKLTGGRVVAGPNDVRAGKHQPKTVTLTEALLETYLGETYPLMAATKILEKLGFELKKKQKDRVSFTVPYWRDHDVADEVDLIEEVVRMRGYNEVKSQALPGHYPVKEKIQFSQERLARNILVENGFFETITTALLPEKLLEKCGCNKASLKLVNPLSEDLAILEPTLVPSTLETVARNEREYPQGRIFELQRVYRPGETDELPREPVRLIVAAWGKSVTGELYLSLKGVLEQLGAKLGVAISYAPEQDWDLAHPGRSSAIVVTSEPVGHLCEVHPDTREKFGIRADVGIVSLDFDKFTRYAKLIQTYTPPPKFPPVKRDLSLLVAEAVSYSKLVSQIKESPLVTYVELFDIYRGKGIEPGKKSLALHLTFSDSSRTLTALEVDQEFERITQNLTSQMGAIMR